mgnify:CR=1 FL=1
MLGLIELMSSIIAIQGNTSRATVTVTGIVIGTVCRVPPQRYSRGDSWLALGSVTPIIDPI